MTQGLRRSLGRGLLFGFLVLTSASSLAERQQAAPQGPHAPDRSAAGRRAGTRHQGSPDPSLGALSAHGPGISKGGQPSDPWRWKRLLKAVFNYGVAALVAPVLWPLLLVSNRILGLNYDFFDPWPVPLLIALASCVFWFVAVSRVLHRFGLWSPFWRANAARPRILRAWVSVREWFELRRFGAGPMARWASGIEVLSCRFRGGDIFLGRPMGFLQRPIGIPTEKHMVTIATTGSGKSTAALIPNLCLHEGSLLCVDPKGELARITARRRGLGGRGVRGMGQRVLVVDPFRNAGDLVCASYNVFDEMARVASYDPDKPVSYAGRIADALVKSMSEREPYWDNAAKTFITGLVLYIFTREPLERRNLTRLRQLITEGDVEEYESRVAAGEIDPHKGDTTPMDVLLGEMRRGRGAYGSCIAEGAKAATMVFSPEGQVISFAAGTMLTMSGNQMGSVLSTAQEHTSFLDIPQIQRISMHSDFLLEDLKSGDVSIYLCMPLGAVGGKEGRWLRMFIMLVIEMVGNVVNRPNPPILLAIDEFPSLGRLDNIERAAATLRSNGVRLWVIGQNLPQFQHTYPGTWNTFFGEAEAVQFLGVTEASTVRWLVERLGEHVVTEPVRYGKVVQRTKQVKPLLDEDQAARLLAKKWGRQIVWRGSEPPLLLKTTSYFTYLPFWWYEPDPLSPHKERFHRRVFRWIAGGWNLPPDLRVPQRSSAPTAAAQDTEQAFADEGDAVATGNRDPSEPRGGGPKSGLPVEGKGAV
jgi:type IV secretion system protein VirD4